MIVLAEVTYPGTKADETATKFVEFMKNEPPPEYVKLIDLYAFAAGDGIRVLTFYEIDSGKEDEGLKYVGRSEVYMLRAIEGYKADMHVVYNMAEAFDFLSMSPPEV